VPLVLGTLLHNILMGLPMASCAFNTPGAKAAELARAVCRAATRGPSLLVRLPLAEFYNPNSLLEDSELCGTSNSTVVLLLFLNLLVGGGGLVAARTPR
jgi:hypothetical protein